MTNMNNSDVSKSLLAIIENDDIINSLDEFNKIINKIKLKPPKNISKNKIDKIEDEFEKTTTEIIDETYLSDTKKRQIANDIIDNIKIELEFIENNETLKNSKKLSNNSKTKSKSKTKTKTKKSKSLSLSKSKTAKKTGGFIYSSINYIYLTMFSPFVFATDIIVLIVGLATLSQIIEGFKHTHSKNPINTIQYFYAETVKKFVVNKLFINNESKLEPNTNEKIIHYYDFKDDILEKIKKSLWGLFLFEFAFIFKITFEYHLFLYFASKFPTINMVNYTGKLFTNALPNIPYLKGNINLLSYGVYLFVLYKFMEFFNEKKNISIEKENAEIEKKIKNLQNEIIQNDLVIRKLNIINVDKVIEVKKKEIEVKKNFIQKNKHFYEIISKNNIYDRIYKLQAIYNYINDINYYLKNKDEMEKLKPLEKIYHFYQ